MWRDLSYRVLAPTDRAAAILRRARLFALGCHHLKINAPIATTTRGPGAHIKTASERNTLTPSPRMRCARRSLNSRVFPRIAADTPQPYSALRAAPHGIADSLSPHIQGERPGICVSFRQDGRAAFRRDSYISP